MSEFPEGWEVINLGTVCDVVRGITFPASAKEATHTQSNVCCLRTSNIQREIDWRDIYFVPREYVKRENQFVMLGDILMSMANSYELVGKVAVVRENPPYPTAFGAFLSAIRTQVGIEGQYLFHLLRTEQIQRELRQGSSQTVNIANISVKTLSAIEIPIAPSKEQKRIADKLDLLLARVDACRERCNRIPLILKHFRQSVLAVAASGELTEDWREQNSDVEVTSALLKRIQDANVYRREIKVGQGIPDPFEIPSTWEWVRLFDICKSITDGDHQPPPKAESGVPFLTISNISKGRLDFNQIRYVPENYYEKIDETRKPHLGDILYTAVGATYGIPVLVDTEERFCFQRHIAILKPSHLINNKYLLYTLQSDFVYRQATDAVTGTAQPTVPLSGLRQIKVPLPPLEEQNEIAYQLEKLFAFADRLEARYQAARAQVDRLTPALLDKAFRGELVPQDPNDEPASVLLEQIRSELATAKTSKPKQRQRVTVDSTPSIAQVIMLSRKDIQPSHLASILKTRGSLTAEDLWTASQLEIDDFYDQLKDEEEQGLLRETRGEEPNAPRLLEAA